jgi:hypothetical protein
MLDYDEWVKGLCRAFRRRCEYLRIPQETRATGLPALFAPCQIYIIGAIDPLFQLMLVTRNASLPDMMPIVQVDVPARELVAELEAFKERGDFRIPRASSHFFPPPGGHETVGGFLDRWLASILANGWTQIVRARPGWMSTVNVGGGAFLSEFRGSVFEQSPDRLGVEMADRLQQVLAPRISQEVRTAQVDSGEPACGAYVFPALQVGPRPRPSFRERAAGAVLNFGSSKVVIRGTFRRVPITIDCEGLVMIVTDNLSLALDRLNRLMAGLLFLGLPALAVRESELIRGSVHPETRELKGSTASLSSLRNIGMFETRAFPARVVVNRIETADLEEAVGTVDRITSRQDISQDLLLLLESTSHLADQEYTPAFLMAWAILERRLYAKWRRHLLLSGIARDRLRKLIAAERWSVDYLIESLDLLRQLPTGNDYDELMTLKDRRNSIVHRGRPATAEEANNVLGLARNWLNSLVAERVGATTPIAFIRALREQ